MLPLLIRARARILDTARKVEAGLLEALRPRITHRNKPHPSIVAFIGTVSFPNHNPAHLVLVSSSIELSIVAEEHLCGL